ncbi:hypothetical protein SAMN05216326_12741 [Nitrosomonas marina]|uniref:Uncharacterized protein n=1 Tax=Nitrosomonas marina TaxID=917 RepID=A0A1I0EHF6_9PROT|nr:hypothetical protein [Nitrosomonas marina]SET44608.1 hypothetical protein SAMN05216326_12741 [Nitrosomonas marina]
MGFDFPNAELPQLKPLANSFAVDEVENDLRNLFIDLFELMLAEQAFDENVLGVAHLGSLDLVRRMVNADGLSLLDIEREETATRYLYKAWKSRNKNGRGFYFLETYMQLLLPNQHNIEQMAQLKTAVYPKKLSPLKYANDTKYSTSRVRISIESPETTWDDIDKMEPILRSIVPARLVLYFAKLTSWRQKNYIGAACFSGAYSTVYPIASRPSEFRSELYIGIAVTEINLFTIYPKLLGSGLSGLYSSMGVNDAGISLLGSPTQDWTKKGVVGMGSQARGDMTPNWWEPDDPSFKALIPWESATCWFVVWPGISHAASNTGVNIKNIEFWVLRESTGEWRLENSGKTQAFWPPAGSGVAQRTEADGSVSFFMSGVKNGGYVSGTPYAVHGSCQRFDLIDGDDIRCVYARLEHRLVLEDPDGVDDRHLAKLYVDVGADYWPDSGTVVADYTPETSTPQVANSRFELSTISARVAQLASINPPSPALDYPAGERSITHAEFELNLPPPLRTVVG